MDAPNVDPLAEMEARQIYKEVYREFYEWEQADAQASIDSLACKNPDDSFPDRGEFNLGGMDACLIDDEDCIIINIENKIAPHPPYTSCAPVSRNVLLPDDADLGLAKKQFLRDCIAAIPDLKYAWQKDFLDPDVEIIRIEVVKRLYDRSIPLNILGDNLVGKVGHDTGLLWAIHQRDWPKVLDWFSEKEVEKLQNIRNHPDLNWKTESVFDAINTCEPAYCSLCGRLACGTHRPEKDETKELRLPVLLEKVAKLSAEELHDSGVTPCGVDCFKHLDMDRYEDESDRESEIDEDKFIIGVLKIDPDILPCDLSFTSKLPCNQIFLYRARFLKQAGARPDAGRTYSGPSRLAEVEDPKKPEQSFASPVHPCVHDGPCDNTVEGCRCYLTGRQCLRSCNCALTCARRRKGCSCYVDGGCTKANQCPCAIQEQECDPELCRKCGARNQIAWKHIDLDGPAPNHKHSCNNVDVQHATIRDDVLISIRRSKYGSGAFSSSSNGLKADTYLGEYHGQIKKNVPDVSSMVDSILAKYTKRNYVFDLNKEVIIDAASMGNVTRYLNEGPELKKPKEGSKPGDKDANCGTEIIYVNEEKHIVLRTGPPIAARKELTLSYGDKYWGKAAQNEGSEEEET
ncbi:SET domain-containing protein [Hymenopellis radicata]|nr:SET domain-containing protein [Hymenopellis radicata]